MELSKIDEIKPLIQRRDHILRKIADLDRVKEFTSILIKGEDGGERESAITFSFIENDKGMSDAIMLLIRDRLTKEKEEVEAKINVI